MNLTRVLSITLKIFFIILIISIQKHQCPTLTHNQSPTEGPIHTSPAQTEPQSPTLGKKSLGQLLKEPHPGHKTLQSFLDEPFSVEAESESQPIEGHAPLGQLINYKPEPVKSA
ncbi:uncharacterized protein LOC135835316 [Planococcus citri]|uniref:uncharacterized protein LOC135835311 n=1 Tax=Planococcus citri TaxID=170843 RepID=UPI0031F7B4B4